MILYIPKFVGCYYLAIFSSDTGILNPILDTLFGSLSPNAIYDTIIQSCRTEESYLGANPCRFPPGRTNWGAFRPPVSRRARQCSDWEDSLSEWQYQTAFLQILNMKPSLWILIFLHFTLIWTVLFHATFTLFMQL